MPPARCPKVPAEDLILQNDPLAVAVAKRYFTICRGLQDVDVVQIARQGLIRAARRYDPAQISPHTLAPVAFSSFAVPYIRGEILHDIRDRGHVLKIPRKLRERAAKVEKEARLSGNPPREVAERYGWDWDELAEVLELHVVYPDQTFFEENLAIDEPTAIRDEILQALARLPQWQSDLVIAHFYEGASIEALAQRLERTADDVQTWINRACARLATDTELSNYVAH